MKIPFFSMFLDYLLRKFKSWLNLQTQVETEKQKQQDEARIVEEEIMLSKESDDAANDIDDIVKHH